jgi:hypothetical protein
MRLHCFKPHSAVGFMRARLPTMDCAAQSPTPHSLRTCAGYPCCIMRFALQICCNIYARHAHAAHSLDEGYGEPPHWLMAVHGQSCVRAYSRTRMRKVGCATPATHTEERNACARVCRDQHMQKRTPHHANTRIVPRDIEEVHHRQMDSLSDSLSDRKPLIRPEPAADSLSAG